MPHFLYITEVFCPWCYGFSPVIQRIQKEYGLHFEVICGALMEEPISFATRLERMPNTAAFIERMHSITNVRISNDYLKLLNAANNTEIFMDSQKGGLLFYTLKHFLPKKSLQIMEDLQDMLYGQGLDLFSEENQEKLFQKYALDSNDIQTFMQKKENREKALAQTEESFEIMGDIVLYPTLYYVGENGFKHFVSRGYVNYEECKTKLEASIAQDKQNPDQENPKNSPEENNKIFSCSLDGKCN